MLQQLPMSIGCTTHWKSKEIRIKRKYFYVLPMLDVSFKFIFLFTCRLPEWAAKAINGPMEYIAQFDYKTYADTPELARLKSGFLLKEMLEHFSQKIDATLKPNRSLWLYSGHDLTILNMLNSLGLYEVCFNINSLPINLKSISFTQIYTKNQLSSSYTFHHMAHLCMSNCTRALMVNIMCKCFIEDRKRNIRCRWKYRNAERNVHWINSMPFIVKLFREILNLNVVYRENRFD